MPFRLLLPRLGTFWPAEQLYRGPNPFTGFQMLNSKEEGGVVTSVDCETSGRMPTKLASSVICSWGNRCAQHRWLSAAESRREAVSLVLCTLVPDPCQATPAHPWRVPYIPTSNNPPSSPRLHSSPASSLMPQSRQFRLPGVHAGRRK